MQDIKQAVALWSSQNFGRKSGIVQARVLATIKAIDKRNKKLYSSGEVLRLFTPPDTGGKFWFRKCNSGFVVVPNSEHLLTFLFQCEWEEIKNLPEGKQIRYLEAWLRKRLEEVPTVEDMLIAGTLAPPRPNEAPEIKTPFTKDLSYPLTDDICRVVDSEAVTLPLGSRELFSFWLSRPSILERVLKRLKNSLSFLRN